MKEWDYPKVNHFCPAKQQDQKFPSTVSCRVAVTQIPTASLVCTQLQNWNSSNTLLLQREDTVCGNKCQPSYFIHRQGLTEVIKEQDSSSSSLTDNDCWPASGTYYVRGNYQHGNTVICKKKIQTKSLTVQLHIQTHKKNPSYTVYKILCIRFQKNPENDTYPP